MSEADGAAGAWAAESVYARPAVNPWLIAITGTLAIFMAVLDTSIAKVALPHIAGSLSVG
jgi:MFS transporter, DHA2 family, multidrug resistance protein